MTELLLTGTLSHSINQSSFWFGMVYRNIARGHRLLIQNIIFFFSLKIIIVLANSADPA